MTQTELGWIVEAEGPPRAICPDCGATSRSAIVVIGASSRSSAAGSNRHYQAIAWPLALPPERVHTQDLHDGSQASLRISTSD